jgi:hypothetical protein
VGYYSKLKKKTESTCLSSVLNSGKDDISKEFRLLRLKGVDFQSNQDFVYKRRNPRTGTAGYFKFLDRKVNRFLCEYTSLIKKSVSESGPF